MEDDKSVRWQFINRFPFSFQITISLSQAIDEPAIGLKAKLHNFQVFIWAATHRTLGWQWSHGAQMPFLMEKRGI